MLCFSPMHWPCRPKRAMRLDAGTIEFEDVKFFYPFRLLESRCEGDEWDIDTISTGAGLLSNVHETCIRLSSFGGALYY